MCNTQHSVSLSVDTLIDNSIVGERSSMGKSIFILPPRGTVISHWGRWKPQWGASAQVSPLGPSALSSVTRVTQSPFVSSHLLVHKLVEGRLFMRLETPQIYVRWTREALFAHTNSLLRVRLKTENVRRGVDAGDWCDTERARGEKRRGDCGNRARHEEQTRGLLNSNPSVQVWKSIPNPPTT